ncbi:fibropellin-1-like [Asterias rubens]|uniref:fibropellin-1-like n=1 Tax=Asterias rubens TaxID=7604 RepID=UPI0014557847|nr:fibropellin-1-like [Asterias rubens]
MNCDSRKINMKTLAICGIVVVFCVIQVTAQEGALGLREADELDERSSSCRILMRDSNNCNNHGYCKEGRNGYSCSCYTGWGGRDCVDALKVQRELEEADELEERSSSCRMLMRDSNNCNNHGYCKEGRNGYSCSCYTGWGGRDCVDALKVQRELEEADELEERSSSCRMLMRDSNNCNNHGYCKEGRNGYSCSCYTGWGGRDCVDALKVQRELEEADELEERSSSCRMLMRDSNNCNNHGYCKEGRNGYSCSCYTGWGGRDCVDALKVQRELEEADELEERSSSCRMLMRDSNNCNNHGYCKEGRNGYSCSCYTGWGGRDCVDDLKTRSAAEGEREVDADDKEPLSKRAEVLELLRRLLE